MTAAIVEMTPVEIITPKRMTNAITTAISVETAPVLVHLLFVGYMKNGNFHMHLSSRVLPCCIPIVILST
jgi:hypothetical protein